MKRYFVTNIEYDTTDAMGCYDIELPTQMVVEVEMLDDRISKESYN